MSKTSKHMTRSDFIAALAATAPDLNPRFVEKTVHEIFAYMSEALARGERIEIRRFGSFETRCRKSHVAYNPITGERFNMPPRRTVHFKPGAELRERVNQAFAQKVEEK